jgi:hypothetical protein
MEVDTIQTENLTKLLCGEMFKALGFTRDGVFARTFSPFVRNPIHRFSEIAVGIDNRVRTLGFQQASRWILPNFVREVTHNGTEYIPKNGPLPVASNHPRAYDALVIAANLPRDDLKIIVNIPIDFIIELPTTLQHFLYAPPDPHIRINVVRAAIKHLKSGGALLLIASGGMDPDPASMTGAADSIKCWSRSIEIFLRKVPETNVLITIVSDILSPKYVKHLFTKFRKSRQDKQRVSEFFQVIKQMTRPGKFHQNPILSFAQPISAETLLIGGRSTNIMGTLTERAEQLLSEHLLPKPAL